MNKTQFKQTEIGDGSAALTTRIPEGWELRELGSLGRVVTGKTPPTKDVDNFGEGYPFITPGDMIGQKYIRITERYVTEKGKDVVKGCFLPIDSVCVSCIGSDMGKVVMTDRPSITNQQLNSLVCEQVEPHFVYYGIINITDKLRDVAFHSTAVPILNKSAFSRFEIPIPRKKSEQRAIAKILSDLDEKIELNRQMNKTLEAIGQTSFKRWFVDFEFPNKNGRPYKSSGGTLVDSALGKIPEGWEVKSLDQIADFLNGLALQKYPAKGKRYLPVIKIRELNQGITESTDKASPEIDTEYIIDDGDILFSWSGSLQVCIWCHGKGALNQHLFKVSSSEYPKWFYFYWVKFHLPEFQHIAQGKATTMGHIQRHHLSASLVVIPPKERLHNVSAIMTPLLDTIISNSVEIRKLSQIRDSLLPRLMSGKIRVNSEDKNVVG